MIRRLFQVIFATLAVGLAGAATHARPPENADPALAPWFQSLRDPSTGGGCCSQADCRPVEYRMVGDHYEVLIGNQYGAEIQPHWEAVEPDHVLEKTDNPTGRAIACWVPYMTPRVLCFVRPSDT
jgi:hypothetical protein